MENFTIRRAKIDDIPQMYQLLSSLADVLSDKLGVTTDELRLNFLLHQYDALVLVQRQCFSSGIKSNEMDNETMCIIKGLILFFPIYSIKRGKGVYVEDYIVDNSLRGKGYGQALFSAFCKEAINLGASYIKLVYQAGLPVGKIYKHFGFINETENSGVHMFEFRKKSLSKLNLLLSIHKNVKPLPSNVSITQASFNDIKKKFKKVKKRESPHFTGAILVHDSRTHQECLITYNLGFCAQSSNFVYIEDIVGEDSCITVDVLGHVIMALVVQYDMEVWINLSLKEQKHLTDRVSALEVCDSTQLEKWNICYMDMKQMQLNILKPKKCAVLL